MAYDLITIGGGLGGATLAKAMAEAGARVLVLERETEFRDRVRGEGMHPWGVVEAKALGVYEPILRKGNQTRYFTGKFDRFPAVPRDMPATTASGIGQLDFSHPEMQETLIGLAAEAGAEVRRGETVVGIEPGQEPAVLLRSGRERARLVVGADGRTSKARDWGGFETLRDADRTMIAGVLLGGVKTPTDTVTAWIGFAEGVAILFPIDASRTRAYFGYRLRDGKRLRLSGNEQLPEFIQRCVAIGAPTDVYARSRQIGPLAEFAGADTWVSHPARDGVALIGDAAGATDPIWGSGLSLTLMDVRVLRDHLMKQSDWSAAADAYATERDHYYGMLHRAVVWLTEILWDQGPEADARRERAAGVGVFGEPPRMPDVIGAAPEAHTDDVYPGV